jgi:hypothetical protein
MDRRVALRMLAAVVASCGCSGAGAACSAAFMDGIDVNAARELGQEYLRSHAQDAELKTVASMISQTRSDWRPVMDELRTMMRADYEAGRLVNLSGWFLSKTEARLLAGFGVPPPCPPPQSGGGLGGGN